MGCDYGCVGKPASTPRRLVPAFVLIRQYRAPFTKNCHFLVNESHFSRLFTKLLHLLVNAHGRSNRPVALARNYFFRFLGYSLKLWLDCVGERSRRSRNYEMEPVITHLKENARAHPCNPFYQWRRTPNCSNTVSCDQFSAVQQCMDLQWT